MSRRRTARRCRTAAARRSTGDRLIRSLTSPGDYSIKRLNWSSVETVLTDRRLRWPDTFSEGPDGRIYVTASHIQDTRWFTPGAPPSIATELYSFPPAR